MALLPFIKSELTEARMFFGPDNVKGKSAEEIAGIIYLIFMMIEVYRISDRDLMSRYADQTLVYNTYDNTHYAGTDLGNLLAILNNQDTFKHYIKVNGKVSIPLFQINRYLQNIRSRQKSNSDDATFFWKLEEYLRIQSNALFRQLRRDVGNWDNLTYSNKVQLTQILRREFDKRAGNVDLYLWFKQSYQVESVEPTRQLIRESKKQFSSVISAIRKIEPSVTEIWFHGSRATGHEHNRSDWDILAVIPGISDRYIEIVTAITGLNKRFKNFDIQPTVKGTMIYRTAAEEGQLLWSNNKITEFIDTKLAYSDTLNPALWENDELKVDVKNALARIANKFSEFIDVKQLKIVDYIITGSNCGYNYTSQSDLDLHVLIDSQNLGEENPLTEPFLRAKKSLWNSGHEITVKGFSVELYAEDVNSEENQLVANGIYSLYHDKWIKKPTYEKPTYKDTDVQSKAEGIMQQIELLISDASDTDQQEIDDLWEHIRRMRRAGLEQNGENSVENLTFKTLRNNGVFDKLRAYERKMFDASLSLESRVIN